MLRGGPAVEPWLELARAQHLVISRRQLIELEGTPNRARRALDGGRWQVLVPGVYAAFTGPVPEPARVWAALLHAGPGAALGGDTVLWLQGVRPGPPPRVTVFVPHPRRVRAAAGSVVVARRDLAALVHPAHLPPQTRVEEAVLDVAATGRPEAVVDAVLAAVQRRVTTPARLAEALDRRTRHPRRALLHDLLREAADGAQSPLERRYHRDVERAHALPPAERNVAVGSGRGGATEYPDVRHGRFGVRVELDGAESHPAEGAFRDRARDNRNAVRGETTLRYGWREVVTDPCGVASQVAAVLAVSGWSGRPRCCGPGCTVQL